MPGMCTQRERPHEDIARRQLSTQQGERSYRNQPYHHLDLGFPNLQNCGKINSCCIGYPVGSILLWQPELTSTLWFRYKQVRTFFLFHGIVEFRLPRVELTVLCHEPSRKPGSLFVDIPASFGN